MILLLIALILLLVAAGWYLRKKARKRQGDFTADRYVHLSDVAYGLAVLTLVFLLGYLAGSP